MKGDDSMKENDLLEAEHVSKTYGGRPVVDDVGLHIATGEILGIIGPNGAGKSTTIDLLLGLRRADSGRISYWRKDYLAHVGVQLQSTSFFPGLSCYDNLRLFAALYKKRLSRPETMQLLRLCGLEEAARTEASRLSGGQQKRLAIAIATVHDPRLVFLDEPTSALDPRARIEIHSVIRQLAAKGTSIILTSHDMEEVHQLADRVMMIDRGRVIAEGTPHELCERFNAARLEEVYLQLTAKEADVS
ncbi:ABC transporter ATP-binding protein [Paenibacillus sp. MSJ-34]|nr:ABC transporter ATP-binding protein [Paenibacillus sp. MSJ-34]